MGERVRKGKGWSEVKTTTVNEDTERFETARQQTRLDLMARCYRCVGSRLGGPQVATLNMMNGGVLCRHGMQGCWRGFTE